MRQLSLKLATFNVRGISTHISQQNIVNDALNYQCDIIALQETKTHDSTLDIFIRNHRLLTFSSASPHYGLGFVISPNINRLVYKHWSVNDRLAVLQIQANEKTNNKGRKSFIYIVNAYAPHSGITKKDPVTSENFYSDLTNTLKSLTNGKTFICGDFNAKIGKPTNGVVHQIMGHHSRGTRNENGTLLVEFCLEQNLYISNTSFKHKACHITTWQGQWKDKKTNKTTPIFNQIDFILTPQNTRKQLTNARSYGGTLTSSDHKLVITSIRDATPYPVKRKPNVTTAKQIKYATSELQTAYKRKLFQSACYKNLSNLFHGKESPKETIEIINTSLAEAAKETLPKIGNSPNDKPYCPIINELSRKQKDIRLTIQNTTDVQIKQQKKTERNAILHKIKRQAQTNKNKEIDDIVESIENCNESRQMFKALDLIRKPRKRKIIIHNQEGHTIDDNKEQLRILQAYFNEKYTGTNSNPINPFDPDPIFRGTLSNPITPAEIKTAIKRLNNNRAIGPDNIQAELLKAAPNCITQLLTEALNTIFTSEETINIGKGNLILLPKPGKPQGPPPPT